MDELTTLAGNRIAFDVQGAGEDLVLIHGITESSASWDPLVPRLVESYRVVRVDLRGHGASGAADAYDLGDMADDIVAVLNQVDADTPLLVGHSLGGFVATVVAARHPVRAVVNLDQPLALAAFKQTLGAVEEMLRGEAFPVVITGLFDAYTEPLPEAERERLTTLRTMNQDAVLGIWDPVFTRSVEELDTLVRDLVSGVDAPYLAIHGEDPGPDYRAWLSGVLPQAEIEVWGESGHYPHLAHPDRFVARLAEVAG